MNQWELKASRNFIIIFLLFFIYSYYRRFTIAGRWTPLFQPGLLIGWQVCFLTLFFLSSFPVQIFQGWLTPTRMTGFISFLALELTGLLHWLWSPSPPGWRWLPYPTTQLGLLSFKRLLYTRYPDENLGGASPTLPSALSYLAPKTLLAEISFPKLSLPLFHNSNIPASTVEIQCW